MMQEMDTTTKPDGKHPCANTSARTSEIPLVSRPATSELFLGLLLISALLEELSVFLFPRALPLVGILLPSPV
jgi:hypothetical protein